MLDANAATMIRPGALVKISSKASMTSTSEPVNPRRSILVLSANSARTPEGPMPMRADRHQRMGALEAVFRQLRFDHRERERCRVNRPLDVRHDVRDAADMILVAV